MSIVTPDIVPASVLLAEPRPSWLAQWGRFAEELRFEDLPAALVEQAKLVLLDCVGVIAAGMQEPEMRALVTRLARRTTAEERGVPGIGSGLRLVPASAALVNGIAGTMLELDEGNQFARGHPGIHVVPAAFAAAASCKASGRDFLVAMILGYEVAARVGAASRPRNTVHPHGTWGTIGAALAVAKLENAKASEIVETINVASSLCLASSLRTMLEGATVRNAYAGMSNQSGLTAWDLVLSGFSGGIDGVRSIFGAILAEEFQPQEMVAELGRRWEIERNYFKRHAACRFTHGALDVLISLIAREGRIDPAAVERIEVESYVWAAQLDAPAPSNMLGAKFSLPFAVATTLIHGEASVPAFRAPAVADVAVRDLARRVVVREEPSFTAQLPRFRPARLSIHFADGRVLSGETFTNRGDSSDPYMPDEIRTKFLDLTRPVWGEAHAERLRAAIEHIEDSSNLTTLEGLLAQAPGKDN
jgi:2-methylcitrate dehydratase PrpD